MVKPLSWAKIQRHGKACLGDQVQVSTIAPSPLDVYDLKTASFQKLF